MITIIAEAVQDAVKKKLLASLNMDWITELRRKLRNFGLIASLFLAVAITAAWAGSQVKSRRI